MNLPPISSSFASSLAGSVKSAADKSSADAAETSATQHQAAELQVDSVLKSTASDDGEADGRQVLDTFERESSSRHQEESSDGTSQDQSPAKAPKISDSDKPQHPRLDLQA